AAFGAVYVETSMPRACTIFLKLGAGCGGAAVVNGRVLRGAAGTAGEFGHLRIAAGGPRCYCGQRGCLETFVNVAALSRAYAGRECTTADLDDLPTAVAQALLGGDRRARRAADALCRRLGEGLVALVNVFNPSTIVLGGPMRPLLEPLLPRLSAAVAAGIVSGTVVPDVRLSTTGLLECAVGAAAVAHHHYFDVPALDPARRETAP
ncbi:MAG: ROK family protein, partial [Hyphomicrobiales bacterium]|nr:ROK family protein [Hyphomicrobiales bacterium]